MSPVHEVPAGWVRAVLDLAIMVTLTEGDRHGYALAQRLSGFGFGVIRGGSLYPVLNRLEAEELVTSVWQPGDGGPGRKVYSLTDSGRLRLAHDRGRWQEFSDLVGRMLGNARGNPS